MKEFKNYTLSYEGDLSEVGANGYVYKHNKTGARVVIMDSEDDNKVFTIGFKTPPENSTGVAHILEHSVLSGSKKFPLKDPFVELVKGSLNTFLNAMTFPDKTIYPVASVNDKDFQNLIEVYLDAVFFPNIYNKREIFLQEGWHYHLENKDSPITYNGVVYNEMKGVYSLPDNIMSETVMQVMLKDTQYGVSSGGDPKVIPTLSYEEFIDFHKTYYHPSNSYILLYGKMDFAEKLEYIDKNYLSKFDKKEVDSTLREQLPFKKAIDYKFDYPISKEEAVDNKSYYSLNTVLNSNLDRELMTAMEIVCYALINSSSSNVKKRFIELGFAEDLKASIEDDIAYPILSIDAKNAKYDSLDEFKSVLINLIKEEINAGFNKESLLAAVNSFEFRYRENDFGGFPKGIYYVIYVLSSMLYDEDKAFINFKYNSIYKNLRDKISSNYFEELAQKYILDAEFKSYVEANPVKGLTEINDEKIAKELAELKETMSDVQLTALVIQTRQLIKFQTEPSTAEELSLLPKLKREDIKRETFDLNSEKVDDIYIYSEYYTNKIAYMNYYFEIDCTKTDLYELGLLNILLGKVSTTNYDYRSLINNINIHTGSIKVEISPYITVEDRLRTFVEVEAKSSSDNIEVAASLIEELLFNTIFKDKARIKELLTTVKTSMYSVMLSNGHRLAGQRGAAGFSNVAYFKEQTSGLAFYDYISGILEDFDEKIDNIIINLERLFRGMLHKDRLIIGFTGSREDFNTFKCANDSILSRLNNSEEPILELGLDSHSKKEGIKTSSLVQYVARCGNFKALGLEYKGYLNILTSILSYEYLWENIRVKGGAYGCMSSFGKNGDSVLVSYRDPNLMETNDVYEALPSWLEAFEADEEKMFKYIIGTMSNIDRPLSPREMGKLSEIDYITDFNKALRQRIREEILDATQEDIRGCAEYIRALLSQGAFCVLGNDKKIEENKNMFDEMRKL